MGSIAAADCSSAPSSLKHRNSISSLALSRLDLPPSPPHPSQIDDKPPPATTFELAALPRPPSHSYVSLRDLLPSSPSGIQSPTAAASYQSCCSCCCCEIPIRNRLVKQAAWAYLQPMACSPDSAGSGFFRRIRVTGCLDFLRNRVLPAVGRAFSRLLGFFSLAMTNRGR